MTQKRIQTFTEALVEDEDNGVGCPISGEKCCEDCSEGDTCSGVDMELEER